ncbi:MAG: MerR family transcriptional regulator [Chloroflexi bacterium]|nr:MerR family transcriptional regulator [Chloroflexota bacterium]
MQGVYIISVAARVLEMHPQTLRKYERIGLVSPSRTVGMLRLYSEEDIARLRLIKHLVGNLGLNLAGVELALRLFNRLISLRARLNRLEGKALKASLEKSIEEMLELLQGKLR